MREYNKLVRDKIPEIMERRGEAASICILDEKRYIEELDKKLNEEVQEYQESKDIEELADILEVIYAVCNAKSISFERLQKIREEKFEKRGGFSKKIFLISKE